uniref:RNA-directed DNA polymerase n=1 Tax=Pedobacter schmidteae TaxID=2201271 RepID=UPI000EB11E5B|nr:RNA-directed DNA polymerase [Pedobacter schmidteae]
MGFTYDEVLEAYIKLKSYIYYDSSNLYMRQRLAIFETNLPNDLDIMSERGLFQKFATAYDVKFDPEEKLELYEKKLMIFTEALNSHHENPSYFNYYLSDISAKLLPKKIKDIHEHSKIITNKRTAEEYQIERSLVFIDAPIEIHLISVLWILKHGVDLDSKLSNNCFGNRLILNHERTAVVQGSGLFKPYQKQYQKWRDGSVDVARSHLESGNNVLMLNLDIKDFFHSVRIPAEKLNIPPFNINSKRDSLQSKNSLVAIFCRIHEQFTELIANDYKAPYDFGSEVMDEEGNVHHYILPIGLLSSFVLANDYLIDFDQRIAKKSKPVYYGRYVDDILMVIVNPVIPSEEARDNIKALNFSFPEYRNKLEKMVYNDAYEHLAQDDYEELSDLEQIVLENFYPVLLLIDKPGFLKPNDTSHIKVAPKEERLFKLNDYKRLYCQSDKTLLYYFDKDESSLVIDKLKRDLEEKSSEFRNYEDAEDEQDFEESAYHLLYDGTEGKIRTLKDYKEDKFGLTVYLSKKIFNALRRADKLSDEDAEKVVRFFRGKNTLTLYSLWERVFVYLLVNNKATAYVKFYLSCVKSILALNPKSSVDIDTDDYQENVLEFLHISHELALSLDPTFLSRSKEANRLFTFSVNTFKPEHPYFEKIELDPEESNSFVERYRRSNLIRHHFAAQPLITYTDEYKTDKNFTEIKLDF